MEAENLLIIAVSGDIPYRNHNIRSTKDQANVEFKEFLSTSQGLLHFFQDYKFMKNIDLNIKVLLSKY